MTRTPFALAPLTFAVALALQVPAPAHAQVSAPQAAAVINVSLPAQPLSQALTELARQTGTTLVVSPALTSGRNAPVVSGRMSVRQAYERLLAGTGLVATVDGAAVVVREMATPSLTESVLPAVTVTAGAASSPDAPASRETGYRAQRSVSTGLGERPLLDTPYSVSVVTAEVMADQQARSLIDIAKNEPSVTLDFPTFDDTVSIRGFGVDMAHRDGFSMSRQVVGAG